MTVKTQRAHRVLHDASSALDKFKDNPIDTDFRHAVVLCCILIRTVGDALRKENEDDAISNRKQHNYYKEVIATDTLYKNFIKSARDSITHEYISHTEWASITDLEKNHRMEYLINEGFFKGEDFRKIVLKSIEFWKTHLASIEKL